MVDLHRCLTRYTRAHISFLPEHDTTDILRVNQEPPHELTWLDHFVRIADLFPVGVTLVDVSQN